MTLTDITGHKPVYRRTDGSIDPRLYYAEAQRRRLRRKPRRPARAGHDGDDRQRPVQDRLHSAPGEPVNPGINAEADTATVPVHQLADGSIDYLHYDDLSRRIRAEHHRAALRWLMTMAKAAVTRCKTGFATTIAFGKGRQAQSPALGPVRARQASRKLL